MYINQNVLLTISLKNIEKNLKLFCFFILIKLNLLFKNHQTKYLEFNKWKLSLLTVKNENFSCIFRITNKNKTKKEEKLKNIREIQEKIKWKTIFLY